MITLKHRRRLGEEAAKKYKTITGNDPYACAIDAITDILLAVAQTEREATQILHSAETEFRNLAESEKFLSEG